MVMLMAMPTNRPMLLLEIEFWSHGVAAFAFRFG
jgi:hypothetical protein